MSKIYTIELTDAQDKALNVIALDGQEWIENVIFERTRIAIDEIVNAEVQRKFAAGEPITGSKEDIILSADVKTAAEKKAIADAETAARNAE